jgi:hypothetical protein
MRKIRKNQRRTGIVVFLLLMSIPMTASATSEVVTRINSLQTQSLKKVVAGILMLLAQSVVNMLS